MRVLFIISLLLVEDEESTAGMEPAEELERSLVLLNNRRISGILCTGREAVVNFENGFRRFVREG
jgi:hypothetical protein